MGRWGRIAPIGVAPKVMACGSHMPAMLSLGLSRPSDAVSDGLSRKANPRGKTSSTSRRRPRARLPVPHPPRRCNSRLCTPQLLRRGIAATWRSPQTRPGSEVKCKARLARRRRAREQIPRKHNELVAVAPSPSAKAIDSGAPGRALLAQSAQSDRLWTGCASRLSNTRAAGRS